MSDKTDMRAKPPLVTVVIVSYNHAQFIECCLDSVAGQTYADIQCVVVDNASTDGSSDIISRYCDGVDRTATGRSFEPILSSVNGHLTKAVMAGFEKARGSYVIFLDGDDYFLPACVETHIAAHLVSRVPVGFTSVDMYQSRGTELVTGTEKHIANFVMSGRGQTKSFCRMSNLAPFPLSRGAVPLALEERDLHLVDPSMSREWVWAPTSGLCLRREVLELMFAYKPKALSHTDAYLARGISALTGSIVVDRPMYVYRLHGSNMFTAHPTLANLDGHDKAVVTKADAEVSMDIVECFRTQMPVLAGRLETPDLYIEAIDMMAGVGAGLKAKQAGSSFTFEFIRENETAIEAAFGEAVCRRWRRRYAWKSRVAGGLEALAALVGRRPAASRGA